MIQLMYLDHLFEAHLLILGVSRNFRSFLTLLATLVSSTCMSSSSRRRAPVPHRRSPTHPPPPVLFSLPCFFSIFPFSSMLTSTRNAIATPEGLLASTIDETTSRSPNETMT